MVFLGQIMVALSIYNWSKRLARPTTARLAGWTMFTASVVTISAVALAYQITLAQIWDGFQIYGDGTGESDFAVNAVILGTVLIVFTTLVNALGVKLMARINSAGVFIELVAAVLLVVLLAVNIVNPPTVLLETQGLGEGYSAGYLGAFLVAALAVIGVSPEGTRA
jgi:amino acid transporter